MIQNTNFLQNHAVGGLQDAYTWVYIQKSLMNKHGAKQIKKKWQDSNFWGVNFQ